MSWEGIYSSHLEGINTTNFRHYINYTLHQLHNTQTKHYINYTYTNYTLHQLHTTPAVRWRFHSKARTRTRTNFQLVRFIRNVDNSPHSPPHSPHDPRPIFHLSPASMLLLTFPSAKPINPRWYTPYSARAQTCTRTQLSSLQVNRHHTK